MKKPKGTNGGKGARKALQPAAPLSPKAESFAIVGIGASAGGLEAIRELLRYLPEQTGMAYVFVQHLDPTHESGLEEILSRATSLPVTKVTDGVRVQPDHFYVIPANTTMSISDGVLHLVAREKSRGLHFPIDHFFHSLAEERGDQAIGVILSGTASDGTNGCSAVKADGGITFAQKPESAKYSSMPRNAIHAGVIDFVMDPRSIANELVRISRHPYIAHIRSRAKEEPVAASNDMETLFSLLREATGVDFMHYKQSTLQRRIKRRMILHRLHRLKDYVRMVRSSPVEIEELYRDILIHVTGFFRDEQAFEALRKTVLPGILQGRKSEDGPIRVWVPGCSTGEEVYSLAIVVLEFLWEEASKRAAMGPEARAVQIFATDISDEALERARNGLFTEAALSGVSPERLKRFFVRLDGGYQINKSVREMCIFAKQNIAKDPPFSNLDLVSCRNLLIYLGPILQKRVIPALHYALKPNGYLLLGASESLGSFSDHFVLVDKKYKIYQKKRTGARLVTYFTGGDYAVRTLENTHTPKTVSPGFTVEREVERLLANRFVPASIVVNDEMEIVQFRGKTGAYLEPASGHPTFSLSKMAREGLLVDLRDALAKAKKKNEPVRREGIRIKSNGASREVDLEVIPVRGQSAVERFYIVVFQEAAQPPWAGAQGKRKPEKALESRGSARAEEQLNQEVKHLREQLQSLIEEHETTLEEFKSANEEVMSANEELQSTNEELETAKEELQSSNEELTTLNEELQNRNAELTIANNDQLNLMASVNLPVVMVGNDLRIRRFTPPAEKLLNLLPGDIGRRLGEVRSNMETDDIEQIARETIDNATFQEKEVRQKNGPWYQLRVRPYKTWDNKIEGAVISFQDIDVLKRTLDHTRTYSDALIENAREAILILDQDLRVKIANPAFYRLFQASPLETENRLIFDLGNRQWDVPALRDLLDQITKTNSRIDDYELTHNFQHLGVRHMLLNARRIEPQESRYLILLSIDDVTEQRERMENLRRQSAMLELAHETIIVREPRGKILFWNRGAEEMYGWTKAEALGKVIFELLQTKFPASPEKIEAILDRSGRWEGELIHTNRAGKLLTVTSRWGLLREDQRPPLVLEINEDVTTQKQSKEDLRRLSSYLMEMQDQERRRIARDLHDSTGQKLAGISLILSALSRDLNARGKARESIQEVLALSAEAEQEIRTLAQILHPPELDLLGFVPATRALAEQFGKRSGIITAFDAAANMKRMPADQEVAFFRVVQECLSNVQRHSGAKAVKIELSQAADAWNLIVSDDGKGMPEESKEHTDGKPQMGVGILGMRERLEQLGGKLEIKSGATGTTVRGMLPHK